MLVWYTTELQEKRKENVSIHRQDQHVGSKNVGSRISEWLLSG